MKIKNDRIRIFIFLALYCFQFNISNAQEDSEKPKFELSGYIKYLHTTTFTDFSEQTLHDNLIHNRLNLQWYIHEHWTFHAGIRNRVFWGDSGRVDPMFEEQLDMTGNDFFDASFKTFSSGKFLGFTTTDRLYIEYDKDKWNIRLGRQRINWGINLIWNPNDLFNAYNFVDFDYEERPGSDAIRIQYNYDYASGIEFVVNPDNSENLWSFAGLWKFNKWNYDFQILGAKADRDLAFGGGWAGNLGLWGFKGEFVFSENLDNENSSFSVSTGFDFVFENGLYFNIGYLYNGSGKKSASFTDLFVSELSYKNLFPYRHALFNQWQSTITPLIGGGLSIIYSPGGSNLMFLNPSFQLSITQDLDLDLVGQIIFAKSESYKSPVQAVYFRTKYSF